MAKKVSISDLAEKFKVNKSLLHFYYRMGLIAPENILGKMLIFDESEATKRIKFIQKRKKNGLTLSEIKKEL